MKTRWYQNKETLKSIGTPLLIVALVVLYWNLDGATRLQNFIVESAPMDTRAYMETFEASSLEACKEEKVNKYKVSYTECVRAIRRNTRECKQKTVDKFPGRMNTIDKMLLAGNFYTSCVFERQEEKNEP